jgi:outer membrane protein, heavy metal efflux system
VTARPLPGAAGRPGGRRRVRRGGAPAAALLALLAGQAVTGVARGQPLHHEAPGVPGAQLEELLAMARRMSPELMAKALEAEAALERVEAEGALPDPVLRLELEDVERRDGSPLPERPGTATLTLEQEFPLWGKRGLQKDVARAEAGMAQAERRGVEADLLARLKTAYAALHAAHEGMRITRELARSVATIAELAQSRYPQGLGSQQEAIAAEIEKAQLETEIARLDGERQQAEAQLNALLGRPPGALFVAPQGLRALPTEDALRLPELVDRALRASPAIAAEQARIEAAVGGRELVERSWFPDVTLGLSAVEEDRRITGYEAMVELALPLRWGVRRTKAREAATRVAAAQAARDAAARRLEGELGAALARLSAARRVADILHARHLPQARLALATAVQALELDQVVLADVLEAERRVRATELEHLAILIQQQEQLAEIERLLGGDL